MKLTNQQIDAFISQLRREAQAKYKTAFNNFKESDRVVQEAENILLEIRKLSNEGFNFLAPFKNQSEFDVKDITDYLANKYFPSFNFNSQEIKEKIIIYSIENKTLEEIRELLREEGRQKNG